MAIEVELPQEIELKIRANKDLDLLVCKRLEHQIKEDLKNDLFILMLFDELSIASRDVHSSLCQDRIEAHKEELLRKG